MDDRRHARLTALFADAIERSAAGRDALLAEVRADDPALAGELAALLEVDGAPDAALATGGLAPTAAGRARATDATARAPLADGTPAPPGTTASTAAGAALAGPGVLHATAAARLRVDIPGFRLLGVLGEGGMGTVWAGEQDAPRRPVAIKVMRASSSRALARFWAEAEIMARLEHPGIARVLEAGEADGHPYFVMERVEGETLDAHVRTAAPPRARRLALFAGVCDAVHHAHVKGVIHRDLKPSNVMVRTDGRVAVLDFGIARVAAADGDSGGDTRAGELIGTPSYMSPEQARLRPDEVDARSDVYTLGVLLYELLSGELPYDVRGRSLPDVARAICHDPPRRLGRRDPTLRGDLEAIADKALAKEPDQRYPSAAALADDVRRHLDGDSVSARVPGAAEQLRRFARRRPGVAAAIAAAVLGSAIFAVVVTLLWLDARAARRAADAARARTEVTRLELERRGNQLVLDRARAALAADPTEAARWLATLTAPGTDPTAAWMIAERALGHGVASAVIAAHRDEARSIAELPGAGGAVVSGGYDGRVRRWDPRGGDGRELASAPVPIRAALPSPDGALLAVGRADGQVEVTDGDGRVAYQLAASGRDLEALAWSSDGAWLAAGDDGGSVWLWRRGGDARRLETGVEIQSLAFAVDRRALVAGDADGGVWHWSLDAAPAARGAARAHAIGGEVLAVWADGERLAALGIDGAVHRWTRTEAGPAGLTVVATGLTCRSGAFAADGSFALLGGVDGRVLLVTGDRVDALGAHRAPVRTLTIGGGDRRVATGGEDGLVQVWDLTRERRWALRGHRQRVRGLAFTGGGAQLWSGDSAGVIRRWDLDAWRANAWPGAGVAIDRLAAAPDGAYLASADADGVVRWSTLDGGGGRVLGRHGARVTGLVIAGDRRVVSAGADGGVVWWSAGAGPAGPRRPLGGPIRALAASADGRLIAAARADGPLTLFTAAGDAVATLPGHDGGTETVALSPDGALVASGGQDRLVKVWRVAAPAAPPRALGPIDDDTRVVAFTAAGDWLVSGGDDGRVRAWPIDRGEVAAGPGRVVAEHRGGVAAIAFDPTGRGLVSLGRDGALVRAHLDGGAAEPAPWPPGALAHPAVALVALAAAPDRPWAAAAAAANTVDGVTATAALPAPRAEACTGPASSRCPVAPGAFALGAADGSVSLHAWRVRDLPALHAALAAATATAARE